MLPCIVLYYPRGSRGAWTRPLWPVRRPRPPASLSAASAASAASTGPCCAPVGPPDAPWTPYVRYLPRLFDPGAVRQQKFLILLWFQITSLTAPWQRIENIDYSDLIGYEVATHDALRPLEAGCLKGTVTRLTWAATRGVERQRASFTRSPLLDTVDEGQSRQVLLSLHLGLAPRE